MHLTDIQQCAKHSALRSRAQISCSSGISCFASYFEFRNRLLSIAVVGKIFNRLIVRKESDDPG